MIIKSYLFEDNKEILKYKSVLLYGENSGLINNIKKKLNRLIKMQKY